MTNLRLLPKADPEKVRKWTPDLQAWNQAESTNGTIEDAEQQIAHIRCISRGQIITSRLFSIHAARARLGHTEWLRLGESIQPFTFANAFRCPVAAQGVV